MKKYDIQPTEENIRESLNKNITGRNENIYQLLQLLNHQEGSWSIAINGDWGSGKTFFVKQCKYVLDYLNSSVNCKNEIIKIFDEKKLDDINKKPFRTVYYDAWEHDNETDPIQSLLACIATSKWAVSLKKVLIPVLTAGLRLVEMLTPIKTDKIVETINKQIQNYKDKEIDFEKLKKEFYNALTKLAPEDGQLIVFVDELDRCKPTYAIKLLERIKHYFSVPNITFIFSVDLSQLQNTAKRYYGEKFDGYHYLDRFFDLVINLPEPDLEKYLENRDGMLVINNLFDSNSENYCTLFCKDLIIHFSFSLRQINHFYLKTNSATYNSLNDTLNKNRGTNQRNGLLIIYVFLLPFMCALNQADIDEYNKFINGTASDNTLSFLANNSQFDTFCKRSVFDDSKDEIDMLELVKEIYDALFNPMESKDLLKISNNAYIDRLSTRRSSLINACSLLNSNTKLD